MIEAKNFLVLSHTCTTSYFASLDEMVETAVYWLCCLISGDTVGQTATHNDPVLWWRCLLHEFIISIFVRIINIIIIIHEYYHEYYPLQ